MPVCEKYQAGRGQTDARFLQKKKNRWLSGSKLYAVYKSLVCQSRVTNYDKLRSCMSDPESPDGRRDDRNQNCSPVLLLEAPPAASPWRRAASGSSSPFSMSRDEREVMEVSGAAVCRTGLCGWPSPSSRISTSACTMRSAPTTSGSMSARRWPWSTPTSCRSQGTLTGMP
jgi:hypothetical protein